MKRRAGIQAATFVLQHVPDLVRYGSKPAREAERFAEGNRLLRSHRQAVEYPPEPGVHRQLRPEALWDTARPWWRQRRDASAVGPFGEIMDEDDSTSSWRRSISSTSFAWARSPNETKGDLPICLDGHVAGAFGRAHEEDEALSAHVLFENLACKAGGVHALRVLLSANDIDPASIGYAIGAGEEAVGDRYNRGGGRWPRPSQNPAAW